MESLPFDLKLGVKTFYRGMSMAQFYDQVERHNAIHAELVRRTPATEWRKILDKLDGEVDYFERYTKVPVIDI